MVLTFTSCSQPATVEITPEPTTGLSDEYPQATMDHGIEATQLAEANIQATIDASVETTVTAMPPAKLQKKNLPRKLTKP
jgi:hypothetical protein